MNYDMDFSEVIVHCSKNDNYGMEIVVGGYIRKELAEKLIQWAKEKPQRFAGENDSKTQRPKECTDSFNSACHK